MGEVSASPADEGAELFARFAYAPNDLGFCGPPDSAVLREGSAAQIRRAARRFSGVWPYLRVMARMSAITDPLDARLVRSYWLGGGVGADLDGGAFLDELLSVIAPAAGTYWRHLTADLSVEAAPDHGFHVFGVYPWTRLLDRGTGAQPLRILEGCRIAWGTVSDRHDGALTVRARRLLWDGRRLGLSEPRARRVALESGPRLAVDADIGDRVAIHWDRVCGRLDAVQVEELAAATEHRLELTNRRRGRAVSTACGAARTPASATPRPQAPDRDGG
ncbi:DUF6390 family protein [Nocardia arizonensis]|uniref:DUF6390 family protein n=1 Tax=Nocardia arizonensis TaxID=1141647 RepID=UPI0009E9DFE9|nr:DUF6390 family protein [Nocardia arizonensis]